MEFETVGKAFADFYYQTFDTDRTQLLNMYGADSMMTFEGSAVQGPELIIQKFTVCSKMPILHTICPITNNNRNNT